MTMVHGAPRLPSMVLERERLLRTLDQDAAISVVRGPAGSGKTVLLAQWTTRAIAAGERVAWLAVSDDSRGRPAFWAELGRRLASLGDEPALVRLGTLSESMSATKDVATLLRNLFDDITRPITIVIDNGQLLDEQVFHDLVDLVSASTAVRVVVATRSRTSFEALETKTRVPVVTVDPSELALSGDETRELLGHDAPSSDAVVAASEGNPLITHAIVLSLAQTPPGPGQLDTVLAEVRGALNRSLLGSIAGLEDARFFHFALRIALAADVTVDLSRELTGCADAEAMLRRAEEAGLGLWTRTSQGELFTMTTLVREVLETEFERRHPRGRNRLDAVIARWENDAGMPLEALTRAVKIGDFDLVDSVIKSAWHRLIGEHRTATAAALSTVPMTTLMRRPLITMLLALIYNQSQNHKLKAAELFGMSITASRVMRNVPPADSALLRGMESAALRVIGKPQRAAAVGQKAAALLDGLDVASRNELGILVPVLGNHVGVSLMQDGRDAEARHRFEAALADADSLGTHYRFQPLSNLAGLNAVLGNIPEARNNVEIARSGTWPARWSDGYPGALYRVAEAVLALEFGDAEEASAQLHLLDPHLPTIEFWPVIAYLHAFVDLVSGEPEVGLERLAQTRAWHASRPTTFLHSELTSIESQLHLARGDVAGSVRVLRPSRSDAVLALARARHALVVGDTEAATAQLTRAASDGLNSHRLRAERAVLELAVLVREGRDAEHQARAACALLAARELRMPLMQLPAEDVVAIRALGEQLGGRSSAFLAEITLSTGLRVIDDVPTLSPRELIIVEQLASQRSLPEIAEHLVVSRNTIKAQVRSLYRKLGVGNRDDAVAAARRHGLL